MRVLIAGCGYVGARAGTELVARGHPVWGLRRSAGDLPGGITPIRADLLEGDMAPKLPRVEAVVFALSADGRTPEAYRAAYVTALANLLGALPEPPERLIYVSSTAVYGDAGGGWVDEETPEKPGDFRGRILLEGEALAREEGGRGVVLRLGGIYGPGRTRLLERVRSGEARCPDGDPVWSNRVHRDDAAGALIHLLEHPDPAPVYLGVDDEPAPLCDVYRFVAGLIGAPEPEPETGLRRDRANKRCSNARLRKSGLELRYPTYREGYRAMVEDAAR